MIAPCLHPRARHKHGTHLAYDKDGCRCAPCTAAQRRESKTTAYRTLTGTHSYVDAARARAHLERLLATLTLNQVGRRSGVHRTSLRVLLGAHPSRPASKRITRVTEAAVLAVNGDRVGTESGGLVDATGTRRRLCALIALGWPAAHLGARLQASSHTTWCLTSQAGGTVRVTTRDAVRALYDELSLTAPPPGRAATRARGIARDRGWPPPLAWDDDTIDDPAAGPLSGDVDEDLVDEHAVELVCDGQPMRLTGRTLAAAVARLAGRGLTTVVIADRVRSDETTVRRYRDAALTRSRRAGAA